MTPFLRHQQLPLVRLALITIPSVRVVTISMVVDVENTRRNMLPKLRVQNKDMGLKIK